MVGKKTPAGATASRPAQAGPVSITTRIRRRASSMPVYALSLGIVRRASAAWTQHPHTVVAGHHGQGRDRDAVGREGGDRSCRDGHCLVLMSEGDRRGPGPGGIAGSGGLGGARVPADAAPEVRGQIDVVLAHRIVLTCWNRLPGWREVGRLVVGQLRGAAAVPVHDVDVRVVGVRARHERELAPIRRPRDGGCPPDARSYPSNAIRVPSGDQLGSDSMTGLSVSRTRSVPSTFIT